MKFVVVNVRDRELTKVGVADTKEEAMAIMQKDFEETFGQHYDEVELICQNGRGTEWDIMETEAWLNTNSDVDYDWWIIEVE